MSDLESLIAKAMKRNGLTHLSLIASSRGIFSACYTPANRSGQIHADSADPVKALRAVLKTKPAAAESDDDFG